MKQLSARPDFCSRVIDVFLAELLKSLEASQRIALFILAAETQSLL